MRTDFLSKGEKKDFLDKLEEQFGIEKINYLFIKSGREKIRAYSGNLSKEELKKLNQCVRIEGIGLYFAKEEERGLRLSIDASNLLAEKIKKNILEIDEEQARRWMRGENLEIDNNLRGILVIKFKEYLLGCGKAGDGRLYNFVPKERRVRN
jgi:NOL1/NOP2/fmu family ribosome biogenesis protein